MIEAIKARRSVRTYDGRMVSDEIQQQLLVGAVYDNPFGIPVEFRFLDAKEHGLVCPVVTGTELYRQLSTFDCFYRCGRAHIVNLNHIRKVGQDGAAFKDGVQLLLPRSVLAGLRKAFFDYFG